MEDYKELNERISGYEQKEAQLAVDMQDQHELIAKLRQGEEHSAVLAAIVDSSDDAIISKNLESVVTSWNTSAERIFGYTAEEMIGKSILTLIPEDRQKEEPLILSRLKRGERVDHFETKRLSKSGKLIDVSLTISPVKDKAGKIIGLSKIARDITEQKMEEQRKNDFIAIISHELKTPLTSMKSYVQLALTKATEGGDTLMVSLLSRADVQTRKMTTMIHDFLNLSRLEEGKMTLNRSKFPLSPLIEEAVMEAEILSASHHIQYLSCPEVELLADRDKIGQVMTNLITNAIKYSNVGSTITISCILNSQGLEISISDEGIGISQEDQRGLFQRFYRVRNEDVNRVSGFGIGLYLVSEILRLHGSVVSVNSETGKGSTFSFILPLGA